MKLGEIVNRIVIDSRKLTEYALDLASPFGRHKALVFERRLGFSKRNAVSLQQQIEALAPKNRGSVAAHRSIWAALPCRYPGNWYGRTTSPCENRLGRPS